MNDEIPKGFIQQPAQPDKESRELKRLRKVARDKRQTLSEVVSGKYVVVGPHGTEVVAEFDDLSSVAKFLEG